MASRKAFVIRPGSLGDLILTLPVIETLEEGGFEVHLAAGERILRFFIKSGFIRSGMPFDCVGLLPLFQRDGYNSLSVDLKNYFSGFDFVLCYCDETGMFADNLRESFSCPVVFHPFDEETIKMHVSDFLLEPLLKRGLKIVKRSKSDESVERDHVFFIHPGSGSFKKNWKAENFTAVAKLLIKRGTSIKIIVGECEARQKDYWIRTVGRERMLTDKPLHELFDIMKKGRWFLGNDSGIGHLASLSGLETFLIYGPTDPRIWAPAYGKNHVFFHETGCNTCSRDKRNQCDRQICLEEIRVEEVVERITVALKHEKP